RGTTGSSSSTGISSRPGATCSRTDGPETTTAARGHSGGHRCQPGCAPHNPRSVLWRTARALGRRRRSSFGGGTPAAGANHGNTVTEWDVPETYVFEDQEVRYGVAGTGAPLVLVHGTPFSSVVWRRIAPYLTPHRRVHWFDLLGYGRSEMRAGQDVSLGVQNRVLAALLDHWGPEAPDVLAHDFGGATALRAHLLDGRDYRSLLLIDPVAISPWGSPFVQVARGHEDAFGELPPYIHDAILRAYIGGAVHRPLVDEDMRRYLDPWLGETGQAAFYRQVAQMSDRFTTEVE